jgi:uncharacterized protein (TIGR00369 family)
VSDPTELPAATASVDAERTALVRQLMPFAEVLEVEILSGERDRVVARVAWAEDRCTFGGALHGGYLMAVADTVGATCAALNLPEGAGTSTIESKTNFFRGVTAGTAIVTSEPLHVGRRTIVIQTDVTRDDGKLVTRTIQTQAVI